MWTEAQMQRRSRQDGRSENSVPDAKKSLPTGQLTTLRPEDGTPPTAGRGVARRGVMGRGEAGWQLGGPSVPHAHAERRAGAASCVTPAPRHSCRRRSGCCHLPADTTPFTPEPQPASPSIWGSPTAEERATLTHVLVTTVLARRGDTPASVRGRIFHVKWPGRESVGGVSRIRSGLCKGPGVRAGGAEAGPLPHLVGAAHPAGHGGARTCPRLATWAELPGLGSSLGSPSWHGDLPQVTALREPRLLVMAPRGPEEAAHRAPGPALGPRAPGSGGRPAQPSEVMRERDGDTEAVKLVPGGVGVDEAPREAQPPVLAGAKGRRQRSATTGTLRGRLLSTVRALHTGSRSPGTPWGPPGTPAATPEAAAASAARPSVPLLSLSWLRCQGGPRTAHGTSVGRGLQGQRVLRLLGSPGQGSEHPGTRCIICRGLWLLPTHLGRHPPGGDPSRPSTGASVLGVGLSPGLLHLPFCP